MRKPPTLSSPYYKVFEQYFPSKAIKNLVSKHGSRVVNVSLPFINLYQPVEKKLMAGSEILMVYSSIKEIKNSPDLKFLTIKKPLFIVIVSMASIAAIIFMHPAGMMITNFNDVVISLYTVNEAYKNKNYIKIAKEGLIFAKMIANYSPTVKITLISFKVVVSASTSLQGFVDGNWLEGSADLIMTVIKSQKVNKEFKRSFSTSENETVQKSELQLEAQTV